MHHLRRLSALAVALLPVVALAHPGHDGEHDDFGWDFSHLAAHPLATLGCLAMLGLGLWALLRTRTAARRKSPRE